MELSKYNVISQVEDGCIIYNTLTSAIVKISPDDWTVLSMCDYERIPKSVVDRFLSMGILCSDASSQVNQYKYLYYRNAFECNTPFVYIAPTMKCNFECFYCFEGKNKHRGIMTEEIALKLVQFLKAQNKHKVNIVWFGGEPMLGFSIIAFLCRQLQNEGIEYSSSMITNGSLFNESNITLLHLLHLKFIQFSMDGVGETHDKRRCFIGGKPSFEIIIKNIDRILSSTEIPVVIQITMDRRNPTAFEDMKNFCGKKFNEYIEKGRLTIGFNNVQNRTGFDLKGTCFTPDELIRNEISQIQDSPISGLSIPALANPCMHRASWHFAIDAQGNLYKCLEQLGNKSERVGSLAEDFLSLSKIGDAIFCEDPFNESECLDCSVFPICGGGCPIDRIKRARGESANVCSKYKNGLSRILPVLYHKLKMKK